MIMEKIFVTLLLIAVFGATFSHASFTKLVPRIVNGAKAEADELPYHATFVEKRYFFGVFMYNPICGATVIADQWLMTAAHCVEMVRYTSAIVGTYNYKSRRAGSFDLIKFVPHPSYDPQTNQNDIALIKTRKPMLSIPGVAVAKLPAVNSKASGGGIASGHGQISTHGSPSDHLLHVTMEIVDEAVCKTQYQKLFEPQLMICAGGHENRQATCMGDSGGPFVKRSSDGSFEAIGVTSYGPRDCAKPGFPAVFTRVSSYIPWIEETIKG